MKLLIINPNSDSKMTEAIRRTAERFARGDFEVVCLATPGAPEFIETYEDEMKAASGMISLARESEDNYDAVVIACHSDPNLDLIKEIIRKPVVGIGEASIKIASMLGHKFSLIANSEHAIPNKEVLVRKYHLEGALASIRAPKPAVNVLGREEEEIFAVARMAIEEDKAEVIVLGCAGWTGLDKTQSQRLGVPVLDSVVCGLIVAAGLAKHGISISKIRRYSCKNSIS